MYCTRGNTSPVLPHILSEHSGASSPSLTTSTSVCTDRVDRRGSTYRHSLPKLASSHASSLLLNPKSVNPPHSPLSTPYKILIRSSHKLYPSLHSLLSPSPIDILENDPISSSLFHFPRLPRFPDLRDLNNYIIDSYQTFNHFFVTLYAVDFADSDLERIPSIPRYSHSRPSPLDL